MTGPTTHREVERKLRVHGLFEMPDLVAAGVAARAETSDAFVMNAVYHDTANLTLFRWGITLRRREGGSDAGWHMKLPVAGADGSSRDELRLPLDSGPVGAVPGGFVEVVAPLLREQPLTALVTLSTERQPTVLFDEEGTALVEVVDDVVSVVQEEATEDIQKLGGTAALDAPYLSLNLWEMIKKRAGWLTILFVGVCCWVRFRDAAK